MAPINSSIKETTTPNSSYKKNNKLEHKFYLGHRGHHDIYTEAESGYIPRQYIK